MIESPRQSSSCRLSLTSFLLLAASTVASTSSSDGVSLMQSPLVVNPTVKDAMSVIAQQQEEYSNELPVPDALLENLMLDDITQASKSAGKGKSTLSALQVSAGSGVREAR